jgi:hypothetical protein
MAKKQIDTLAQIDSEIATLKTRELQLLEQQRLANEALQIARTDREQQILDGNDDVDSLARVAARISDCEHRVRGCNDAVIIISEKVRQLAAKKADEIRWQERRKVSERMGASAAEIEAAYQAFKPALEALVNSLDNEKQIFEVLQTIEHLTNACGNVLAMQLMVICSELTRQSQGLLDPNVVNPIGVPPLSVEPQQLPVSGRVVAGSASTARAEYPPRDQTPHSVWPQGTPPVYKDPPTREQILEQNRKALHQNYPTIYGAEDGRSAVEVIADEQKRLLAQIGKPQG